MPKIPSAECETHVTAYCSEGSPVRDSSPTHHSATWLFGASLSQVLEGCSLFWVKESWCHPREGTPITSARGLSGSPTAARVSSLSLRDWPFVPGEKIPQLAQGTDLGPRADLVKHLVFSKTSDYSDSQIKLNAVSQFLHFVGTDIGRLIFIFAK